MKWITNDAAVPRVCFLILRVSCQLVAHFYTCHYVSWNLLNSSRISNLGYTSIVYV